MRHAVVVGASGLVGAALVQALKALRQNPTVTVLSRRPLQGLPDSIEQHTGNLTDRAFLASHIPAEAWVFCCVGTTMGKAGSPEAFRQVDLDIPVALGVAAKNAGVQGMTVVSSIGANAQGFFFYTRVKGEMEESLQLLNLPALHIFRPGLLIGKRAEARLGEKVGQLFSYLLAPFMIGPFAGYGSIRGSIVAKAMVTAALRGFRGTRFFYNWQMRPLARGKGQFV